MIRLDNNAPEVRNILDDKTMDTEQRYRALKDLKEEMRYAADDGKITRAQQVFIAEMIKGASQAQAYRIAYPDVSEASVYSSASRLMDRPSIQGRIEDGLMQLYQRKMRNEKEVLTQKRQSIIDKREVLDDIIHGRRIGKTTTANKDTGASVVKFREDPMVVIHAIKLDLKLEELQEKLEGQLSRYVNDDEEPGDEDDVFINEEQSPPDLVSQKENQPPLAGVSHRENASKNKKHKKPCQTLLNVSERSKSKSASSLKSPPDSASQKDNHQPLAGGVPESNEGEVVNSHSQAGSTNKTPQNAITPPTGHA